MCDDVGFLRFRSAAAAATQWRRRGAAARAARVPREATKPNWLPANQDLLAPVSSSLFPSLCLKSPSSLATTCATCCRALVSASWQTRIMDVCTSRPKLQTCYANGAQARARITWHAHTHPLVAAHSEALAGDGLAVAYALDQAVANYRVRVLACEWGSWLVGRVCCRAHLFCWLRAPLLTSPPPPSRSTHRQSCP